MKLVDWKEILIKEGIKPFKRMVIHCDIDKTLTIKTCWNKDEAKIAKVFKEIREFLWSAHNDIIYRPTIIIYTARKTKMARETIEWLYQNNIPWPISFHKDPTDLYIDDKAITPDRITRHIKGKKVKH